MKTAIRLLLIVAVAVACVVLLVGKVPDWVLGILTAFSMIAVDALFGRRR